MSTNHNRIRVADLETNQPNKILKTNLNGELEFIDASTLQTDTNNVKLTGNQTIKGEKVFSNTNGNPSLNATVSLSGTAATNFSSTNDGLALYVAGFNNKKEIARIIAIDGSATALNLYNQNSATGDFLKAIDSSNNTVTKVDKDGVVTAKSFVKTGGTNEQFLMADGSVKSVNLQTENYNALDCTTEGKALDARQGKVLKDMIDNKTVNLASDAETQINTTVSEDSKIVSRSKLFNWWQWVKSQTQTISGAWNFTNKVTFASGNTTTPPLIVPNGTLTNTAQNGALERDSKGILYTTSSVDGRQKIVTENNAITLLTKFSSTRSDSKYSISSQSERIITTLPIGLIPSNFLGRLNISVDYSMDWPYTGVQPTSLKIEYFLKIVNGFYSSSVWGSNNLGQYFLFKSINLLGSQSMNTTYTEELTTAIRANYNNLGNNGNRCGIGIGNTFLNTRKTDNSDNELPANCQFQIIERTTWQYDDANNDRLSNAYRRVISGINAFYIEKVI